MEWKEVIDSLREGISVLRIFLKLCSKSERNLTSILYEQLKWEHQKQKFDGLFGWGQFEADHRVTVGNITFIAEVKKVTEGSEYGYWHAAIQGLLYQHQLHKELQQIPVLCIILDWGRKSKYLLNESEHDFLDRFRGEQIYFSRIRMDDTIVIEHNLAGKWETI